MTANARQPLAEPDPALRRMTAEYAGAGSSSATARPHGRRPASTRAGPTCRRRRRDPPGRSCSRRWLAPAAGSRPCSRARCSAPSTRAGSPDSSAARSSPSDLREWDYGAYEGRNGRRQIRADEPGWTIWTARDPGRRDGRGTSGGASTGSSSGRSASRATSRSVRPGHCLRILAARWVRAAAHVGGALLELSTRDRLAAAGLGARDARHRSSGTGRATWPWLSDGRPGGVGDLRRVRWAAVTARAPDDPSAQPGAGSLARRDRSAARRGGGRGPRHGCPGPGLAARPRRRRASRRPARTSRRPPSRSPLPRLIVGAVTEPFVLLLSSRASRRGRARGGSRQACSCSSGCCRSSAPTSSSSTGPTGRSRAARRGGARRAGAARRVGRGRARGGSSSRATSCSSGPATSSRRTCALTVTAGLAIDRSVSDRRVGAGAGVGHRGSSRRGARRAALDGVRQARTSSAARGEAVVVATGTRTETGKIAVATLGGESDGARRSSASSTGSSGSCS